MSSASTSERSSTELAAPTACFLDRGGVERIAGEFAHSVGYQPGGDIEAVVARVGGRICHQSPQEWYDEVSGSIEVFRPGDFTIYLAQFTGHLRDRFTIAHELGHYLLHSRSGQIPVRAFRQGSGRVEWEANWFAGAFLMPEDEMRRLVSEGRSDGHIGYHFRVSGQAVSVRKKALGI